MKFLRETSVLISAPELAQVLGIEFDTVNNWIRRGIIGRSPIGGRQLRNRFFSAEEVYKTALKNELVRLGIPPSPASDAVNDFWKAWDKKAPAESRVFVILLPRDTKWTVLMFCQNTTGGPLQKIGKSSGTFELPKQAFAVLPVSHIFDKVTANLTHLLSDSEKRAPSKGVH